MIKLGTQDFLGHNFTYLDSRFIQFLSNQTFFRFLSPVFSVKVDTETAKKIYPPHSKQYKVPRYFSQNHFQFFLIPLFQRKVRAGYWESWDIFSLWGNKHILFIFCKFDISLQLCCWYFCLVCFCNIPISH